MRQSLLTVNSCQWNSKGEETDFFVKMCSVRKKARLHIEEPPVTSNPLYMAEIIEKICTFLHPRDLKRCQRVNRTWYRVSTRELHFRKLALVSFRWLNSPEQRHQWDNRDGNVTLYHHAQTGALDAIKEWNNGNAEGVQRKNAENGAADDQYFTLLFATGAVYVQYMVTNDLAFVLISELYAAAEVKSIIRSSLLFLSTLKLICCEDCAPGKITKEGGKIVPHSDLMVLKMPKLPNLHPFQSTLDIEYPEDSDELEEVEFSTWRQKQVDLFKAVTGIDPEVQKIEAIVVLNVRDLIHAFRRVWQDYGPFPLIGCDSEGLARYLNQKPDLCVKKEELNRTTCGFVIVADPENPLRCASVVLQVDDDYEKKIIDLQIAGFRNPKESWGIALSSCLRGYDGDDITNQTIEEKDEIQKRECKLFHSIVGQNYVAAQVEDVFGTNQILENNSREAEEVPTLVDQTLCDSLGLYTPDIYFNDSATVFLVVGQK